MRMRVGLMLGAALGAVLTTGAWSASAAAQATPVDSTPYVRARDMVSNGEVEQGRQAIDSLLKAATPGTPAYAEGLYWRAVIAQNAQNAERDYRQIVVDYPLSSRVPDALLRLGQLEAARGDREAALQHFQRVVIEYPESRRRAEASYWVANSYLSRNDLQRGCTANADALARVDTMNVELRNRIQFQQLRCRGVQLAAAPAAASAAAPAAPAAAPSRSEPAPTKSATREVPVAESRATSESTSVAHATDSSHAEAVESTTVTTLPTKRGRAEEQAEARAATKTAAVASRATAKSTRVVKTKQQANAVRARSAAQSTVSSTASASRGYAVQVAAYKSRVQADALAAKLRARGYPSHVDGDGAPYRVRIGHYHTRADAVAVMKRLKARKIDGFVAEF